MSETRVYENDGGIHCIGNGMLAAYGQGPNMIQVFGPPYSSPSYMKLNLCDKSGLEVISRREPQTAVWHHQLFWNGEAYGLRIHSAPGEGTVVEIVIPLDRKGESDEV